MEKDLWARISNGDDSAYRELYNSHADMLYAYGMKINANDELVTEAIQLLFITIFTRRKFLSRPDSIKAYLFTSIKRIILRKINLESSKPLFLEDLGWDVSAENYNFDLEIDPQSMMIKNEEDMMMANTLQQALDKLNKQQREVIYLRYYKNMSSEEVGEIIGTNSQVIRNMTYKIIRKLREENIFYKSLIISILSSHSW